MTRSQRPDLSAAEARIKHILSSKGVGGPAYWRMRGRERFKRELTEDGVSPDEASALIDAIDRELFPPLDLNAVLQELREREFRNQIPPS